MQDLRFAVRTLRKQPVFTLVAVLTLALGIGANAAIFSLLYQVLLRPLPYRAAHRLVFVWNAYLKAGQGMSYVAIPDYLDRRADAPALEDAALLTNRDASLSISGRPEQVTALAVTPSFFSTLGRGPFLGRAFVDADATPGADRFTILTYPTWTSRFGADRDIIGRTIHLNAGEYIVVGVLPADFEVPWPAWKDTALLVPFSFTPAQRSDEERGGEFSMMIGRLREGATIEQLDAQMQTIVTRLMDRVPARAAYMRNSGFTGLATGFREELVRDVRLSSVPAAGRRARRPADRMCQRREPVVDACDRAPARARDPRRPRCEPLADRAAAVERGSGAVRHGRRLRSRARRRRTARARRADDGSDACRDRRDRAPSDAAVHDRARHSRPRSCSACFPRCRPPAEQLRH